MTALDSGAGAHVLVFPFPSQGHMIPLLDLTHQLATRGLSITVLVTPQNLSLLNPLLSKHPSIRTLVLPFPPHPSIPAGVENSKDLSGKYFGAMLITLGELYNPIVDWFRTHPSPPVAIISDMFLGWTQQLACELGIHRVVFSPSGAMSLSAMYSLWRDLPKIEDPTNLKATICFSKMPNSPVLAWWQVSGLYRRYIERAPFSEFTKDIFRGNIASWGLVINSFTELERDYLDYLANELGHDRVWDVGPLHFLDGEKSGLMDRGGPSSVSADDILTWLDTCGDNKVVYACFGSQAVLNNRQMEGLALGLEKSGARFIWSIKEPTNEHVEGDHWALPPGFEDRVAGTGRGLIIRGWSPQVMILSHRAVGAFLTHCGWNSIIEGLVAGVSMLAWPMAADQFLNSILLVNELKVAVKVCEGAESVPDSTELARAVTLSVSENWAARERVTELRRAAVEAIKPGGSSAKNLDALVKHLSEFNLQEK